MFDPGQQLFNELSSLDYELSCQHIICRANINLRRAGYK